MTTIANRLRKIAHTIEHTPALGARVLSLRDKLRKELAIAQNDVHTHRNHNYDRYQRAIGRVKALQLAVKLTEKTF